MRNTLLALCCFATLVHASAQYPKLLIQLTNKGATVFNLSNPSAYLSQRAMLRRTRQQIPIDSFDLPVCEQYLDSIRLAGQVTILSKSKWLNEVLIQTTDQAAINKILSFPFVSSEKGIGYRTPNYKHSDDLEKHFENIPASEANRQSGIAGDIYDYGSNYAQVHIHEGEFLHNKGFQGETMQITILDAGFYHYKTVTAFDSLRNNGQVLGERDFVDYDNSVNEDDSHGMYCLSTMSANWPGRMVGTAPKANYWLVRTENDASEYPIEEHNWAVGAEFADSTGSDMISSSLGYYDFDDPSFNHSYTDLYHNSTIVSKAAAIAARKGMIVTNSAGNEGTNSWKYLIFPADADSICSVGAVNAAGVIANFSSFGYPGKVKPNIVSVGAGTVIAGLNNQPVTGNGTSFSNPNVAGLIACLWEAFPSVSNMKILDAVYRSCDRYATPDNRFGFGIPDFKTAYYILKHEENVALYGNDWLFATPDPFVMQIDATVVGRIDGPAKLELLNSLGQVIAVQTFNTATEEVYKYSFTNLSSLPDGFYSVKYSDADSTKSVSLKKGHLLEKDWLVALPNPFRNSLAVYIKAPETGEISLRLIDAKGSIVDRLTTNTTLNEIKTLQFSNVFRLAAGAYYLEYVSKTQKRTVRLLKE